MTTKFRMGIGLALLAAVTGAAQLPPQVQLDRLLLRVEQRIEEERYEEAVVALEEAGRLAHAEGLELPDRIWFRRASLALTLVQATVHALKKEEKEHSDKEHGVVCGYVGPDRATQDDRRAVAAIHYGFKTNNPVSTLSMLVAEGQFWRVDYCVDDAPSKIKQIPQVRAYTIMVDVSLPGVAESVSGGEARGRPPSIYARSRSALASPKRPFL